MASTVRVKVTPLKLPRKVELRVGILEPGEGHEGGLTVGALTEIHEFGLGNVPERSFIRAFADEKGNEVQSIAAEQLASGVDIGIVAERVAVKAAAMMRNRISDGLSPDLAESTKRRKKYPPPYKPLIETGVLRNAIAGDAKVTQ